MSENKIIRKPAIRQIPTIMAEMQAAAETLENLTWGVSIFGGARTPQDSPWYRLTEELGAELAAAGLPVIAGGGPGIMEAANKGAFEAGGQSVGLNIQLPKEKTNNPYQTHSLNFEYFYSRKATFFMHSVAYIGMPGGWGTLDEIFEVMTLVQTGKIPPAPILLIGSSFWNGLFDWVREQQLGNRMISASDLDLVTISDSIEEVMGHITAFCDAVRGQRKAEPMMPKS